MTEYSEKRLGELIKDEDFLNKVGEADSLADVKVLLAQEGVEVTEEELNNWTEEGRSMLIEKGMITEDGEISEELLATVSGGVNVIGVLGGVAIIAASCYVGSGYGAAFGAVVVYASLTSKNKKKK